MYKYIYICKIPYNIYIIDIDYRYITSVFYQIGGELSASLDPHANNSSEHVTPVDPEQKEGWEFRAAKLELSSPIFELGKNFKNEIQRFTPKMLC